MDAAVTKVVQNNAGKTPSTLILESCLESRPARVSLARSPTSIHSPRSVHLTPYPHTPSTVLRRHNVGSTLLYVQLIVLGKGVVIL